MVEIWKDIIITKNGVVYNFEGKYQVSNLGRVRSLNYNRTGMIKVLKQHKNNCGYLYVGLQVNGKQENFLVGRLVATAFIPNPDGLPEVNHIREFDKEDNSVDNLEWCTREYNMNYGTRNKRQFETRVNKGQTKKIICLETGETYDSVRQAGKEIGVSATCIKDCCKGRQKTCSGLHLMYFTDLFIEVHNRVMETVDGIKAVQLDMLID